VISIFQSLKTLEATTPYPIGVAYAK